MLFLDRQLLNWFIFVEKQFSSLVHGETSFQTAYQVILNLWFRTFIVLGEKKRNKKCFVWWCKSLS